MFIKISIKLFISVYDIKIIISFISFISFIYFIYTKSVHKFNDNDYISCSSTINIKLYTNNLQTQIDIFPILFGLILIQQIYLYYTFIKGIDEQIKENIINGYTSNKEYKKKNSNLMSDAYAENNVRSLDNAKS